VHSLTRRLLHYLAIACVVVVLAAAGTAAYAFWPHQHQSEQPGTAVVGATTVPAGGPSTSTTAVQLPPTTSATHASTTTTVFAPAAPQPFDGARAMAHVRALAEGIGVRQGGGEGENAAMVYIEGCLRDLGFTVEVTEVPLPDGRVSHDVSAALPGASATTLLLGAHVDSMLPSPGGNDNASGVGVLLELARDLARSRLSPTIEFVFFGSEEVVDKNADHHHYGSRSFVQSMTAQQASALAGMISVDMIAYGSKLAVRTMGRGPRELADMLLAYASATGVKAVYERDPGPTGWSDHEAFEHAGYPVAWVERITDDAHHTRADTCDHCDPALVQQTGELLLGFLEGVTEEDLAVLSAARRPGGTTQ
jgi:hypothetical protein